MTLNPFRRRSNALVGVDICSTSVKLLEFERKKDKIVLKNLAVSPLKNDAIVQGRINNLLDVVNAIEGLKLQSQTKKSNAAISVPGSTVITKQITMAAGLKDSDMESQAWYEASKHFPDIIGNLCLDFNLLGINKDDPTLVDVQLVACRKETLEERTDILEESGFIPKIVDVDFYALHRATQLLDPAIADESSTVAYINIGRSNATLVVLKDNSIIFNKSQPINGAQMLQEIVNKLDVDDWLIGYTSKAKKLDPASHGEILAIMAPSLVVQARQFLQYFYSAKSYAHVDKVVLSGEVAVVDGVAEQLQEQINIPTVLANPFVNVEFQSELDRENAFKMAPAFMMCCGLALRGVHND